VPLEQHDNAEALLGKKNRGKISHGVYTERIEWIRDDSYAFVIISSAVRNLSRFLFCLGERKLMKKLNPA